MKESFRGRLCVTKETFRKNGRTHSLGHCRLQVPAEAVSAVGLKVGDQYRAYNRGEGVIEIRKAKAANRYDRFTIKEPEAIRFELVHVLYIQGNRISLASRDYPLSDIDLRVEGEAVVFNIPDDLPKLRKTKAVEKLDYVERPDLIELRNRHHGTAYAVALDAARYGTKQHALGTEQLVSLLRNAGHRLAQVSPRLWSMDGKTAALSDLVERARRIDQDAVFVAEAA